LSGCFQCDGPSGRSTDDVDVCVWARRASTSQGANNGPASNKSPPCHNLPMVSLVFDISVGRGNTCSATA
jgi:hypothetical protein